MSKKKQQQAEAGTKEQKLTKGQKELLSNLGKLPDEKRIFIFDYVRNLSLVEHEDKKQTEQEKKVVEIKREGKSLGEHLIRSASGEYYKNIEDMGNLNVYETLTERIGRTRAVVDMILTAINADDDIPESAGWLVGDALDDTKLALGLSEVLYDRLVGQKEAAQQ